MIKVHNKITNHVCTVRTRCEPVSVRTFRALGQCSVVVDGSVLQRWKRCKYAYTCCTVLYVHFRHTCMLRCVAFICIFLFLYIENLIIWRCYFFLLLYTCVYVLSFNSSFDVYFYISFASLLFLFSIWRHTVNETLERVRYYSRWG